MFQSLFLAALVLNLFLWQSIWLGAMLLVLYTIIYGHLIGTGIAPREHPALQLSYGIWGLFSGLILAGSLLYYAFELSAFGLIALTLLSAPIALFVAKKGERHFWQRIHRLWKEKKHHIPAAVWGAAALLLLCVFLLLTLYARNTVTDAVRSAWPLLPEAILGVFFVGALLLSGLLYRGRERALTLPLTSIFLFAFLALALVVFPLGYGFDAFIHKTTELYIAEFGTITPKPFYYIGQYVLVLLAQHVFFIPVEIADSLLVPLLTAALLPMAWYGAAAHLAQERKFAAASVLGLFLLPLGSFIVTTPQGLANLWILLTLLAAIPLLVKKEAPNRFVLLLGALATLLIHPIAGIPLLLFALLIAIRHHRIPFWVLGALGSIALPASFVLNSLRTSGTLGIDFSTMTPGTLFGALGFNLFLENRFNPLLDFAYIYGFNAFLLLLFLAVFGMIIAHKHLKESLQPILLMAVILVINYLILATAVDFSFLIDYERQNYAARLIPILAFFLSPFLIIALARFFEGFRKQPVVLRGGALILLAAIMTSAFYLTYPREDAYERHAGFNVSQSDINAVFRTDDLAGEKPYLVLANQSVSAAAIQKLGFKAYYGDLFFYPIPTGGELYQLFLEMNDRPSRETAFAALDLANLRCGDCEEVRTVFYLVNDYWHQAPRIVETAKNSADSWIAINGGKIHIFRYDRP